MSAEPTAAESISKVHQALDTLTKGIHESVVGYEDVLDQVFISFIMGRHVLLEGVPGIAKTTMAQALSAGLELSYKRIQFTQDVLPTDITGHYFFNQRTNDFEFREGPLFANVILADEINRASAKTQSALLEAMQEGQVTVEGDTFDLPKPFFVIATQNPVDTEGVYDLPVAQLDRFAMKVNMDYLPRRDEREVLDRAVRGELVEGTTEPDERIDPSLLQHAHEQVHVDDAVVDYVLDLVEATRREPSLTMGASTRAGIHLLEAARARALIDGRDYVIPDDVKRQARAVLRHRLQVTVDAELENRTSDAVLEGILDAVEIPEDGSS